MNVKRLSLAGIIIGLLAVVVLVVTNRPAVEFSSRSEWVPMGPSPIDVPSQNPWSGPVTSVALAGSSIYIGAAGGGVWEMQQGGHSWTPLTDNQPTLSIESLAVDPLRPQTTYAGTGDGFDGRGILKTTNGGKTWSVLGENLFNGQSVVGVAVPWWNDNLVYAATDQGVYKSQNGGLTWHQLLENNTSESVCDVQLSPDNPFTVYATLPGVGIEESTNDGASWKIITDGLPTSNLMGAKIGVSPNAPNVLYIALATTRQPFEFFASTDGGTSWVRRTVFAKGQAEQPSFYDGALTVDPHNPKHLFLGTGELYESYDGGKTWKLPSYTYADYHAAVFNSHGTVYIGNDGGVFMLSSNDAVTDLNYNLDITQFYPGLSQYDNGNVIIGGSQGTGAVLRTGSNNWEAALGGNNGYTAVNPKNSEQIFSTLFAPVRVLKSNNRGRTWKDITPPQIGVHPNGIYPLELSPSNPNTVLFGADKVYESTNGGITWNAISPILAFFSYGNWITALAQTSTNPRVIYVGTEQGQVFVTTDGGRNWVRQQLPNGSPTWVPVSAISVDPSNPYDVYVSFGGASGMTLSTTVFHSPDVRTKQSMWMNVTGNLPASPVNAITRSGNTVYAGTDQGVFESSGDSFWTKVGSGLPNALVTSVLDTANGTLIVGTYGRGVWELRPNKIS